MPSESYSISVKGWTGVSFKQKQTETFEGVTEATELLAGSAHTSSCHCNHGTKPTPTLVCPSPHSSRTGGPAPSTPAEPTPLRSPFSPATISSSLKVHLSVRAPESRPTESTSAGCVSHPQPQHLSSVLPSDPVADMPSTLLSAGLTHPCSFQALGLLLLRLAGAQGPAFLLAPLGQGSLGCR